MVMFLLNFVKGSKSAEGGPIPLADMDRGGSKSASGFGPGGPILGGSKSARTPAFELKKIPKCHKTWFPLLSPA